MDLNIGLVSDQVTARQRILFQDVSENLITREGIQYLGYTVVWEYGFEPKGHRY